MPQRGIFITAPINLSGDKIANIFVGLVRGFDRAFNVARSPGAYLLARSAGARVWNDGFARFWGQHVIPAVRGRIPVRSGRLKRTLRVKRTGPASLIITMAFWGRFRQESYDGKDLLMLVVSEGERRNRQLDPLLQATADAVDRVFS